MSYGARSREARYGRPSEFQLSRNRIPGLRTAWWAGGDHQVRHQAHSMLEWSHVGMNLTMVHSLTFVARIVFGTHSLHICIIEIILKAHCCAVSVYVASTILYTSVHKDCAHPSLHAL